MARASRHGGASLTPEESNDPQSPQPVRVRRAEVGPMARKNEEEEPLAGSNSSRSSGNDSKSNDNDKPSRRQPARTTESHSAQQAKETDSTARSTGGGGQKGTSKPSGRSSARASTVNEDDFEDF